MCRLLALILALGVAAGLTAEEKKTPPKKANRLARETSPYLLQHAHNPVDWYPWGPEAFEKAKKEGKLIFLSIGYSSCHWCHVMEKESFANEQVAALMNRHFVCIKVDREERPDIDDIYMTALQANGQRGGWPLSMFLTADGKPIAGGTYWPREDREIDGEKIHGFKTILQIVHNEWKNHPKDVLAAADRLADLTKRALAGIRGIALLELDRKLVAECSEELKGKFDPRHGGFGAPPFRGPKFPMPPRLLFLLEEAARSKDEKLRQHLNLTLDQMARGGICDQIGGGFARYSTERTWTVPHFEKMLYDNALLVEVYSRAWQATQIPAYQRIVRDTLEFVRREMTSPDGLFYSALDADSEGEEGRFYVWTPKEWQDALPEKADRDLARKVYGLHAPNFEGKYIIPTLPQPLADVAREMKITEEELLKKLQPIRDKLFTVRSKRERPFLDTKALTAWNGLMIAGHATAGETLGEKKYIETATRAAEFLLKNLRNKEGRLYRTWSAPPNGKAEARLNGYLDDYACLVHGLLALHDATKAKKWLAEAARLTDLAIKWHGDEMGAFYYTSSDHEKLFARSRDTFDGVTPSGNSLTVRNLVRLWIKTKEEKYQKQAEKAFKTLAGSYKQNPGGMATFASALGLYLDAQKK